MSLARASVVLLDLLDKGSTESSTPIDTDVSILTLVGLDALIANLISFLQHDGTDSVRGQRGQVNHDNLSIVLSRAFKELIESIESSSNIGIVQTLRYFL